MSHIVNDTYAEHMQELIGQAFFQQDTEMIKRLAESLKRNGYTQKAKDTLEDMYEAEWYCGECEGTGRIGKRVCPHCQDVEETEVNDRLIIGSNMYYE